VITSTAPNRRDVLLSTLNNQLPKLITTARRKAGLITVVAVCGAGAALPVAAQAFNPQPDPPGRAGSASVLVPSKARVAAAPSHQSAANTVVKSTEFAGYQAATPDGLASASATFTIPTLNCSSDIDDPLYLGVTTSTDSSAATIRLLCNGTTPTYTYWVYTPAGMIEEPATAGDVVVASLFQTASWTEAEIHDLTNGQYWVGNTGSGGTGTGAVIGVNEPYSTVPLPQITPTTFSSVQVNGDYLGFENPTQYNLERGSDKLFTSSALSSNGTQFTVTWKSSS
jgi:hypothetical protein